MAEQHAARQAEPGARFTWHDVTGERVEIEADAKGVVRPKNAAEVATCDAFGLPVVKAAPAGKDD
jgi:hypothetical protein